MIITTPSVFILGHLKERLSPKSTFIRLFYFVADIFLFKNQGLLRITTIAFHPKDQIAYINE